MLPRCRTLHRFLSFDEAEQQRYPLVPMSPTEYDYRNDGSGPGNHALYPPTIARQRPLQVSGSWSLFFDHPYNSPERTRGGETVEIGNNRAAQSAAGMSADSKRSRCPGVEADGDRSDAIAVRSRSQVSSTFTANDSLSRSVSILVDRLNDLLAPQTGVTSGASSIN